jgi:protein TonB
MSIAKLDLYNPEWLELVFDDKNKDYGAYDLRKHYAQNQVKAMLITFLSVAALFAGYMVLEPKANVSDRVLQVYTIPNPPTIKKDEVIPPRTETTKPPAHAATIKFPVMVPTDDPAAKNPPAIIELDGKAISTETKSGNNEAVNIDTPDQGSGSDMGAITEHNKDEVYRTVEVEPEPFGGAEAWAKFLQKNIHYPPQAAENGVHGKVFLSFIVETDGHLSNFKVERGVGSGLDEEALRVLKLAPAWKPGIQNGHKVRVMYNIPINFVMPDQE